MILFFIIFVDYAFCDHISSGRPWKNIFYAFDLFKYKFFIDNFIQS